MRHGRRVGLVAAVALAAGCGSAGTTVGTSSVPDAGGAAAVDGGASDGGVSGGGDGGGVASGGGGGAGGSDGGMATTPPCSTTPTLMSSAWFRPMASDGSWLYGFAAQQIARIPLGGGATETVVGGIDTTIDWALLVDDRSVYWTVDQTPETLFRAPKSGGGQPVSLGETARQVIPDGDYLYSLPSKMGGGSEVVRIAKRDGTRLSTPVAEGGILAALDGRYIYWLTRTEDRMAVVQRFPKTLSGSVESIGRWQIYSDFGSLPTRAASDGTSLFVLDFGRIVRVDLASGTTTTIFDIQQTGPDFESGSTMGTIAVDGDSVYWSTAREDDAPFTRPQQFVHRVGKDGSGATTLVGNRQGAFTFGVAGDSIYYGDGLSLYRRCKR